MTGSQPWFKYLAEQEQSLFSGAPTPPEVELSLSLCLSVYSLLSLCQFPHHDLADQKKKKKKKVLWFS